MRKFAPALGSALVSIALVAVAADALSLPASRKAFGDSSVTLSGSRAVVVEASGAMALSSVERIMTMRLPDLSTAKLPHDTSFVLSIDVAFESAVDPTDSVLVHRGRLLRQAEAPELLGRATRTLRASGGIAIAGLFSDVPARLARGDVLESKVAFRSDAELSEGDRILITARWSLTLKPTEFRRPSEPPTARNEVVAVADSIGGSLSLSMTTTAKRAGPIPRAERTVALPAPSLLDAPAGDEIRLAVSLFSSLSRLKARVMLRYRHADGRATELGRTLMRLDRFDGETLAVSLPRPAAFDAGDLFEVRLVVLEGEPQVSTFGFVSGSLSANVSWVLGEEAE